MDYNVQKTIFDQYAEGSIHGVEMIAAMLATIEPNDLRTYFMVASVASVEFDKKLGLEPERDEAARKLDMQHFAARLLNSAADLFSETFDGFVSSIALCADGTIVAVEQDVCSEAHKHDLNTLPTTTRVFDAAKLYAQ